MEKNEVTTIAQLNKRFTVANYEIKKAENEHSIFWYTNRLNQLARKNEFCDNEKVKPVADLVKNLHSGRYPFSVDLFPKVCGKFVKKVEKYEDRAVIASLMDGETIKDEKGRDVVLDENDVPVVVSYLPKSLTGVFRCYKNLVAKEIRETAARERAEKRAEKSEKAHQDALSRARQKQISALSLQLIDGTITPEEFAEKVAILKASTPTAKPMPTGKATPTKKVATANVA